MESKDKKVYICWKFWLGCSILPWDANLCFQPRGKYFFPFSPRIGIEEKDGNVIPDFYNFERVDLVLEESWLAQCGWKDG